MKTRLVLIAALFAALAAAQQSTIQAAPATPQPTTPSATPSPQEANAPIVARNTAVPATLEFVNRGGWSSFWQRFTPANVGAPDLHNPDLIENGATDGTLYLSLHQVLQLALVADLDIADAAYQQLLARPDYFRTLAGGTARGVAGETISSALFSGAIGANGNNGGGGGGTNAGSVGGGGSGVHGGNGGYDPQFSFTFTDEHSRTPLENPVLFGTAVQILNQAQGSASFGQGFTTGTGYSISGGSFRSFQNSDQLFLNPEVASDISIGVQQQLLNGGSREVNRAAIVMGQNSLKYADAYFKGKVIDIVAQAATQYWTLATAGKQVDIAQQAQSNAQKTLDDTHDLITQGKVPQANLIAAQASFSSAEQARLQAQTDYSKAISKMKLFLAKQWSPTVINTRIVASDELPAPLELDLAPVPQLVNTAVNASPQLAEDRVNVNNGDLIVKIRKNSLLPTLAVFASYTASGISGRSVNCSISAFPCPAADLLPSLPGGLGNSLSNVFSYQAPDYGVGFQLNVPVFNRINRADEATAEIQVAQQRVDLQKDQNAITELVNEDRLDMEGEVNQLRAARATQQQQMQNLNDVRDRYTLGRGTIDDVITAELAVVNAQRAVLTVEAAYAVARIALAKDSGTLLEDYHITLGQPLNPGTVGRLK